MWEDFGISGKIDIIRTYNNLGKFESFQIQCIYLKTLEIVCIVKNI